MYNVYSIIRAEDRCEYDKPDVSVQFSSNSEEECHTKLEEIYNEYRIESGYGYSDEDKKQDWYKEYQDSICWEDSTHNSFIDDSGYKHYIKYSIIKVM